MLLSCLPSPSVFKLSLYVKNCFEFYLLDKSLEVSVDEGIEELTTEDLITVSVFW